VSADLKEELIAASSSFVLTAQYCTDIAGSGARFTSKTFLKNKISSGATKAN
jgi:hypothetical protein